MYSEVTGDLIPTRFSFADKNEIYDRCLPSKGCKNGVVRRRRLLVCAQKRFRPIPSCADLSVARNSRSHFFSVSSSLHHLSLVICMWCKQGDQQLSVRLAAASIGMLLFSVWCINSCFLVIIAIKGWLSGVCVWALLVIASLPASLLVFSIGGKWNNKTNRI